MKNLLFAGFMVVVAASSFAQSPAGLSSPTKEQLESTIGGMGLSMGDKLSLRGILQKMQEKGEQVKADDSLSDAQKVAKITKIRQDAINQTQSILNASQQQQLAALLLPQQ